MDNKNVFWKSKFPILGCARSDYGIITLKNSPSLFGGGSDNFINDNTSHREFVILTLFINGTFFTLSCFLHRLVFFLVQISQGTRL